MKNINDSELSRIINAAQRGRSDKKSEPKTLAQKPEKSNSDEMTSANYKIILVTNDWSGLGFALDQRIKENGDIVIIAYKPEEVISPDDKESYEIQGQGLVPTVPLDKIFQERGKFSDWYWVFDGNHNVKENEILREEGFKVFGGGEFTYSLENDREFGMQFAESCGFQSPECYDFSSVEDGIKFLEEHEEEMFVYKPNNEDSAYTTVPMSEDPMMANKEIRELIKALGFSDYILQKYVRGIEVNVESWYIAGRPVFTFANLEDKRLHNGDMGSPAGCAFDLGWQIKNDCGLAQMTVRKFDAKMKEINYTGFMDCNCIIADYNEVWFLEFCGRFGYNSHPNLSLNLLERPILEVVCDMVEGRFDTRVKIGFGASVNVNNDHYKMGLPITVPELIGNKFHLFDGYLEDDQLLMGGFGKEIGIVCDYSYTPKDALVGAMNNASRVIFSNRYYRTDCDSMEIRNSVPQRFRALQAMDIL